MRIQHNIMAMNAYRNYNTNTSALSKNLEKLSSGYKINRAGDDAAGLAISEKMRAQITGLNAAQKNVKDGISLVKTAEGAMQEIQDMLNRMDYLATQSANGTYDDPVDRLNLQKEVDQLRSEINRIADSANFNGIQLLDGSQASGAPSNVGFNLKIETADCTLGQLHEKGAKEMKPSFEINLNQALSNMKAASSIAASGTFDIKVNVGGKDIEVTVTTSKAIAKGGNASIGALSFAVKTGDPAAGNAKIELTNAQGQTAEMQVKEITADGLMKFELKKNASTDPGVDFTTAMDVKISSSDTSKIDLQGGISTYNCNTQNTVTGYSASNDKLAHGEFELTAKMAQAMANGGVLKLGDPKYNQVSVSFDKTLLGKDTTAGKVGIKDLLDANGEIKTDDKSLAELVARISVAANDSETFTVGAGSTDKMISLTEKYDYYDSSSDTDDKCIDTRAKFEALINISGGSKSGSSGLTLQIGDTAQSFNQLTVSIGDMHTTAMKSDIAGNTIADINIGTREGAQAAIQTIRDAINYVSGVRGDLGATQNRLEHTANNLSVMAENIQDAESTIRDTDVAEEMMKYTKNNILVQSAQAMLAQANAVPQGVLQLLG